MDNHPRYFIPYPVAHIYVCRYLGFCLGRATELVLESPWKGGEEDCRKALRYLELEQEEPFPISECSKIMLPVQQLLEFFNYTPGDLLWQDISRQYVLFLINLYHYTARCNSFSLLQMFDSVHSLRRIFSLRDTTGQIYEGMTGLPQMEARNE